MSYPSVSTIPSANIIKLPHAGIFKFGLILVLLLTLTLTILGGIVWGSAKKIPDSTEKTNIIRSGKGIVGCAGVALFFNIVFYLLFRKNF